MSGIPAIATGSVVLALSVPGDLAALLSALLVVANIVICVLALGVIPGGQVRVARSAATAS